MRIFFLIFILLLFFSCKKSTDSVATSLLRTESTDYNGNVFYSEYGYDNQARITKITNHENSGQPVIAITISYNGNEAVLQSHPDIDPLYNRTTEVHLTLDANGRMLKRIEYTEDLSKPVPLPGTVKFTKDTLICQYDVDRLLNKTTESRFDST